jgi:hypothetical protein
VSQAASSSGRRTDGFRNSGNLAWFQKPIALQLLPEAISVVECLRQCATSKEILRRANRQDPTALVCQQVQRAAGVMNNNMATRAACHEDFLAFPQDRGPKIDGANFGESG